MFNVHRAQMFETYNQTRDYFIRNWNELVDIEKYVQSLIKQVVLESLAEIEADYNEASFLNPFWQNYPPEKRGRSPRGDQFPWIEVGEHSVGFKGTFEFVWLISGCPVGTNAALVGSSRCDDLGGTPQGAPQRGVPTKSECRSAGRAHEAGRGRKSDLSR